MTHHKEKKHNDRNESVIPDTAVLYDYSTYGPTQCNGVSITNLELHCFLKHCCLGFAKREKKIVFLIVEVPQFHSHLHTRKHPLTGHPLHIHLFTQNRWCCSPPLFENEKNKMFFYSRLYQWYQSVCGCGLGGTSPTTASTRWAGWVQLGWGELAQSTHHIAWCAKCVGWHMERE